MADSSTVCYSDLSSPEREAVEQLIPGYRRSYAKYSAQFTQAPDIHKRPRSAKSEHPARCSFTDRARGNGDAIAQNESDREAVEEPLPGRRRFSLPHITLATDVRRRSGRAASELPSRCSFTDRVQVTEDTITQHESDLSTPDWEAVEELLPGLCRSNVLYSLPHITLAPDVCKRPRRAASEHPTRCSFTDRIRVNEDAIAQHENGLVFGVWRLISVRSSHACGLYELDLH
ncbi:uncharacterized protein [Misgurnus anguillicaudatus]|uniref:uncharacterized protein n=1 Tax=Misgurnus anguillicaudatus TaxID=75329 RepID=UPI003CCF263E